MVIEPTGYVGVLSVTVRPETYYVIVAAYQSGACKNECGKDIEVP